MEGLLNAFPRRDQKPAPAPSVLRGMTDSRTGRRSTFQKQESSFGGVRKVTVHPFWLFSPRVPYNTCPSTMDPHTTEGKQDRLLSQQISEKTECSCVSVGSTTSQLCDFGLLNVPVMSAFEIMVSIRTRGGTEFLILWDWEFLH